MSENVVYGGAFLISSSKRLFNAQLCLAITLVSCSSGKTNMEICNYINAFEASVSLDYFSIKQGKIDAASSISDSEVVLLGGYSERGAITTVLRNDDRFVNDDSFPSAQIERTIRKDGLGKIVKRYLLKELNHHKSGSVLDLDDGRPGNRDNDWRCYNKNVRDYAITFNEIVLANLDESGG